MVDVIVVGGGHAGIEAALACAKLGKETLLFSMHTKMIGTMPCNPSIGGPAKGIVVREIDALGGQMGITADATALQFKMLNTTKGPGVQSLRVQSDKIEYAAMMQEVCLNQPNLTVIEEMVIDLLNNDQEVCGVVTVNASYQCRVVILTTGTFLDSKIMISDQVTSSGPDDEPTTALLTQALHRLGVETFRLKTGTPPRVYANTIDFSKTAQQPGTDQPLSFSFTEVAKRPFDQQLLCYLTYTNDNTHGIIKDNLHRSSMYSGVVKGVGPRYCPSIEDKIVRFNDKERHQIFLEPESLTLDTTYIQGFSTSLPINIQDLMIRTLPGLENCIIKKHAYAIEYDAVNPLQLKASLELRTVNNLFTAGQINGTSGYEEAAGQGLMAGINAVRKLNGEPPVILGREEAYIGVMIDDLITKGTLEPYRLLTSRAEYRLLLRHDNADQRLTPRGFQIGLISEERYTKYLAKLEAIGELEAKLNAYKVTITDPIASYLQELGYEQLTESTTALALLKRPHVEGNTVVHLTGLEYPLDVIEQVSINQKYEGYIIKAKKDASKLQQMDSWQIPETIDYQKVEHLSLEARQKLSKIRPSTLGQASRISGVNPADITVLLMYLQH